MRCILTYVQLTVTKVFFPEGGKTATYYLYFLLLLVQVPNWPSTSAERSWEATVFLRVGFNQPNFHETTVYTIITINIFALFLCVKKHNAALHNQPCYRLIILPLKHSDYKPHSSFRECKHEKNMQLPFS